MLIGAALSGISLLYTVYRVATYKGSTKKES